MKMFPVHKFQSTENEKKLVNNRISSIYREIKPKDLATTTYHALIVACYIKIQLIKSYLTLSYSQQKVNA